MITNLKSYLHICCIDMYSMALYLITDVYCDYMFRLVYSHLPVNSRHKFQAPACRYQHERGQVFFLLKLNTLLIIPHTVRNEVNLVVIVALRFCHIFTYLC
jgi:hypothetical protein